MYELALALGRAMRRWLAERRLCRQIVWYTAKPLGPDGNVHVYPSVPAGTIEHDTTGAWCWCEPELKIVCPQCEELDEPNAECWECDGEGLVRCPDSAVLDERLVVVHRDR